jgi:catabolite regulation protein CreA
MKNILTVWLVALSMLLVSCGQKDLDDVIVTTDTPIEDKIQAEKVCQPIIKYITCSIEKAPEAGKGKLQNALKEMQRKIENDEPSKVAQECDNMVKVLTDKADVAFKNGCFVESAYTQAEVPKVEVTPPAPVTPEPVVPAAVVKE